MNLLSIVLLPFLGALLPSFAVRRGRAVAAWTAAIITTSALLFALQPLIAVFCGRTTEVNRSWLPQAGLDFALRMDGLAALFVLLILGIGLLVILYAHYYLSEEDSVGRFYGILLLFMGSMLGVVLSDNLLQLLVFWELTSLSSFLLIGFRHQSAEARRGAVMALVVTGAGGLALLAGFLLLGYLAGTYRISVLLHAGDLVRAHPFYTPTLLLILLGAFTKSAQFPFHFWLPRAMAAPTPVSAYLHSATMVKAGIFLLARLFPVLAGTDLWFFTVGGTGLVTLVFGAYTALFMHDLKGLLAYSTISHLGLIVLLFGIDTPLAAVAGVFHIINHATFKASLFMAAGIIEHETGTRDMRLINGLWQYLPHTATLAMVAAAAMAGVPLLNGFLSKEMFFAETLHLAARGSLRGLLPVAATLAGIFAVAYSSRFIHDVFFNGEPRRLPKFPPHEAPRFMRLPVVILVGQCLLVGIFPTFTVAPILALAAGDMLNEPLPDYSLAIWHGFNTPLAMSLVALIGGILLYSQRQWLFALHQRVLPHFDAHLLFRNGMTLVTETALAFTMRLANGSLQRGTALLLLVAMVAVMLPFLVGDASLTGSLPLTPVDGLTLLGAVVMMAAALITVQWQRQRFSALIALSVVGLMVALTFVRFSAPDLALTQLAVEVVTILLLLLALFFLPQQGLVESSLLRRGRDLLLALGVGSCTGLLTWGLLTRPYETIAKYYLDNSVSKGGGANVVNVILVDFRGFDTLGEITVLAIAAVGIFVLLDTLCLDAGKAQEGQRPWAAERHPLILSQISRLLLPLALMVSVHLFLRGHHAPGGGFIAGLVTAVALILQYMASGIAWTRRQWRLRYHEVIAWGVLIATATGVGSWLFGRPFLTSAFGHFDLPLVGELELASVLLFDLGVYLAVVGVVMLILATLGNLSQRCAETRESV
ncbi:MAG: monovalent cation/H+ antiporter subunit A [Desulfobulbaceae bacterium]|nr:monovalent cation/H+ antiporter subunit A [Desulfobulbaceae bacterium]